MASRKNITTLPQERTGLLSQRQGQSEEVAAASMDPAGEADPTTSSSEEDEAGGQVRSRSHSACVVADIPGLGQMSPETPD